jgi:hypothetical protein
MTIDAPALLLNSLPQLPAAMQAAPGFSLTDLGHFQSALQAQQPTLLVQGPAKGGADGLKLALEPLKALDTESHKLEEFANGLNGDMTTTDMLMYSTRLGMWGVHCTFMSSIASKGTEGIQQLLRQQS